MTVTLDTYALITTDDLKLEANITGTAEDERVALVCNRATYALESFLDRHLLTRGSTTLYYTMEGAGEPSELWVNEWPIVSITSVHEDSLRGYGASFLLVANTDYIVHAEDGKLVRIWSATSARRSWDPSFRAVKVVGEFGYKRDDQTGSATNLPWILRDTAMRIAVRLWREIMRGTQGMMTQAGPEGSWSRYSDQLMSAEMQDQVRQFKRFGMGSGRRGVA